MTTDSFVHVSPVIYEGLGYTKEDIEGKPVTYFLTENSIRLWEYRREQLLAGKLLDSNVEYTCVSKDGKMIQVVIEAFYRIQNGKVNGAIVAVREIKNG